MDFTSFLIVRKPLCTVCGRHGEVSIVTIRIYICGYVSCGSFPDSFKGSGVEDYKFSSQLSGIPHCRRSTTTMFPIVGSQEQVSSIHQPMVPVEHTTIDICNALGTGADSILAAYIAADTPIRCTPLAEKLGGLDLEAQHKIETILDCLIETI